jgi:hypothetical protein
MELYASRHATIPRASMTWMLRVEGTRDIGPGMPLARFSRGCSIATFTVSRLAAVAVSDDVGNRADSRRKGKHLQSQRVIEHWIRLYNRLIGASYRVSSWPCVDSSETDVDAVCTDGNGHLIALEHTRVGIQQGETHASCSMNGFGSPGIAIIESVLEFKLLKLSAANADKRILLLESDSVAGSIEDQYARVRDEARVRSLRSGVDEIWGVLTAILETENVIFTNRIDPAEGDDRSLCSLNLLTGEFWRLCRDRIPR